jgi:hypothetical protein
MRSVRSNPVSGGRPVRAHGSSHGRPGAAGAAGVASAAPSLQNRSADTKTLLQRWQADNHGTLSRPVLLVGEAQEMQTSVLAKLRLLSSADLDSNILLTIVLAGDGRLTARLRSDVFLPLASRMRLRRAIKRASPRDLRTACAMPYSRPARPP